MRKNKMIRAITGFHDRSNDVIFNGVPSNLDPPRPSREVVIFFGGDCQDSKAEMEAHPDNRPYAEWNLQSVAELLAQKFPLCDVLVIKPSRMTHGTFACYDNFVQSNLYGVPTFSDNYGAWEHLKALLDSTELSHLMDERGSQGMKLIGFSKGCVVLNQMVHELFHYLESNNLTRSFIYKVHDIYWLDGGHAGKQQTWITDRRLIEKLANLDCKVHVHVTPYQIKDPRRPWIGKEERKFSDFASEVLRNGNGSSFSRTVHFKSEPRSIENHFKILNDF